MCIDMVTNNSAESSGAEQMPLNLRRLTLIVATTFDHGIGQNGKLPWPMLKGEMAYFARVTKRPPDSFPQGTKNAVVMGRKTWESIPPKFRPLKDRVNLVISKTLRTDGNAFISETNLHNNSDDFMVARTLEEGIDMLDLRVKHACIEGTPSGASRGAAEQIGNIFIIGGASIYSAALQLPRTRRILLTKVRKPSFRCDTFFPVDLDSQHAKEQGWRRGAVTDLESVTGEYFGETDAVRQEGEVEYEFCIYERRHDG